MNPVSSSWRVIISRDMLQTIDSGITPIGRNIFVSLLEGAVFDDSSGPHTQLMLKELYTRGLIDENNKLTSLGDLYEQYLFGDILYTNFVE